MTYRQLSIDERQQLIAQGCSATDWQKVWVKEGFDTAYVHHTRFSGEVKLGVFRRAISLPGGVEVHAGIWHAMIHNCTIGDDCHLYNIHNYIANYDIGDNTCIENVNSILVDGRTTFGNGLRVPVMNEGGGREIPIFDFLSASLAYVLTLYRHRPALIRRVDDMIDDYAESQASDRGTIGSHVRILNVGSIKDVRIGGYAQITGTSRLKNGSINSNKEAPVKLGSGVKCADFIISSGVEIGDSTIVDKCFVGQGCIFDKHYSAGESLFFSNCQGMHGEATAIFAGPYTVTHHKSTLLIAGMFSFLNAGSGSNQSNHMYKLGPIHQGIAERGAKTTSDSYLLWPSKVGAFNLVMGRHTNHADTSDMPFSYLIENNSESFLVPGANLRTVGTIRDAQKWPKRDLRKDPVKLDQINYNLLSPYTVQKMWNGREQLLELQRLSGTNTEVYGYHNCKIRNSSLRHGIELYGMGIKKFLGNSLLTRLGKTDISTLDDLHRALKPTTEAGGGEWIDLAGLIAPKNVVTRLLDNIEDGQLTLQQIQQSFVDMHTRYYDYEWTWAAGKLELIWGCKVGEVTVEKVMRTISEWKDAVLTLDRMVYDDARKEFDLNSRTGFGVDGDASQQNADFESVRGKFEDNAFVCAVKEHMQRKNALGEAAMSKLKMIKKLKILMQGSLTILGCGSAMPTYQNSPSGQILCLSDKAFLIDCGEGTQLTMRRLAVKTARLYNVFISHLHGDHCFGLIGLISTFGMMSRTQPLHIYAHPDLERLLTPWLEYHCADLSFEVVFHHINPRKSEVIYEDRTVRVTTIPLKHKVPCCGFLFSERHRRQDDNGGFFIEERKRYAYCSDTMYSEKIIPLIEGVDTLFHEATYTDEYADKCKQTMHSTAAQAASIAAKAGVGKLFIGHYSARVDDHGLFLKEAKAVFPDTVMAEERHTYDI